MPKSKSTPMTQAQQVDLLKTTLWGGPDGEGLVHTVAKLAMSVTELTDVTRKKVDVVLDKDGEEISLRRIADDLTIIKGIGWKIVWGLASIGVATLLVAGRSLQVALQGHV